MNTKDEIKFLRKSKRKFDKIPAQNIKQRQGTIWAMDKIKCSCFGAWVALFFDISDEFYPALGKSYEFESGEEKICDNLSETTLEIMENIADVHYLFGTKQWKAHPKFILQKTIMRLEK